jgi:hypothetical protein
MVGIGSVEVVNDRLDPIREAPRGELACRKLAAIRDAEERGGAASDRRWSDFF